jgi:hypothetical protein
MPVRIIPSASSPSADPRKVARERERLVGGAPPEDHENLEQLNDGVAEVFAAYAAERGITRQARRTA